MPYDPAAYEAMVAAQMQKLYGARGMALPTAVPTPDYGAPAAPPAGAGFVKPLTALAVRGGIKSLLAAPAVEAGAGMSTASGMGLTSGLTELGAGPTLANASMLPGAQGGAAALAPVASGAAPVTSGMPTGLLSGAAAPLAGLAFVASAPLWAPYVNRFGGKFGAKVLGMNTDSNRWRHFDPNKVAAFTSKRLDRQLPGFEGASQESQAALLQKANDIGILNLPGIEGQHSGNEHLGFARYMRGNSNSSNDKSSWYRNRASASEWDTANMIARGEPIQWKHNLSQGMKKKLESFIAEAKGILTKPPEAKK